MVGDNFMNYYNAGVEKHKYSVKMHAIKIMIEIMITILNCGKMYLIDKGNINRCNNLSNVGVIKSSNLCVEIVEPVGPGMISVCNLGSIKLDRFADIGEYDGRFERELGYSGLKITKIKCFDFKGAPIDGWISYDALSRVVRQLTRNLDKIIDNNYYPESKTRNTNMDMRPIGIGVQGLADLFCILGYPYESNEARLLNYYIFKTIYYNACYETMLMAQEYGPYPLCFKNGGSPAVNGKLQYDNWPGGLIPPTLNVENVTEDGFNVLKDLIKKYGMRNSLLVALMPTASTAQILGSSESFEPYTSNVFTRTTLSGQIQIVNPHLQKI